jgi:HD-GYP domain-containing protein (c-di-GMP phosphodiesterase class II)
MQILVLGVVRDLFAADTAPGLPLEEVASLRDLAERCDPRGALVLAPVARLEAERAALEAWLQAGGRQALVVGVVPERESEDALRRLPFLHEVVAPPLTPLRLRLKIERARDLLQQRLTNEQLDAALLRKTRELHELNKIGVALSAERDSDALLEQILRKSREITAADAGSLYLVERGKEHEATDDDRLRFMLAQNDSVQVPFEQFTMPLNQTSIAGYVALAGQVVSVADAYQLPAGTPYSISRSFDETSGYRTKSMLVVPMCDHQDKVIGVLQLINKKRDPRAMLRHAALVDENVVPFTSVDEELVSSLASQAAVAFENTLLIAGIKNLFDSFVRASVTAIEARDPTTSGHSERVAVLTVGLAEVIDRLDGGRFREVRFTADQLQEIRYASLLHDFGKVGVREKVLIKGKKLYVGEMMVIRQRFAYIKRSLEAELLRAQVEALRTGAPPERLAQLEADLARRAAEVDDILKRILTANEPALLEDENFRILMDLPSKHFVDLEGQSQPYLTTNELSALSIRRGSLSEHERREIESHVTHTFRFLSQIPWTGEYRRIPDIAYAHHEKLDGSGYPRRLRSDDIPLQSKMMTIADIYDALVAWDRPYKKAVPVTRALDILHEEAGSGKLDRELLGLFVEAKVWEKTLADAPATR